MSNGHPGPIAPGAPPQVPRASYEVSDESNRTATQTLRSLRDFIRYAVSRFEFAKLHFGHGSDNAYDEAVHLTQWALHLPAERLDPFLDAALTQPETDVVLEIIEHRIATRKPAAYLTGQAWLHGLAFICDERALVPRSLLVEAMYDTLPQWLETMPVQVDQLSPWPTRILDLCCGSASIAIHAALMFESSQLIAADISEPALALAQQNIAAYQLNRRISTVQSDLGNDISGQFDLILCNPPYVPNDSMAQLPAEFLHEPDSALRAGDDGMDLIARLVLQAPRLLGPQGMLLIEIGHEAAHFAARFADLEYGWLEVSAGPDMIVVITREQIDKHVKRRNASS